MRTLLACATRRRQRRRDRRQPRQRRSGSRRSARCSRPPASRSLGRAAPTRRRRCARARRPRGGERARVALLPFCSQRGIVRAARADGLDAGASGAGRTPSGSRRSSARCPPASRRRGEPPRRALHGARRRSSAAASAPRRPCSRTTGSRAAVVPAVARTTSRSGTCTAPSRCRPAPDLVLGLADPGRLRRGGRRASTCSSSRRRPATPAQVRAVPLRGGPPSCARVTGTLAELGARRRPTSATPVLRVGRDRAGPRRARRRRPGAARRARRRGARRGDRRPGGAPAPTVAPGRTPHELFAAYLAEQEIDDPRLGALFAELLDEERRGAADAAAAARARGLRRLPRADRGRLRRRRPLRARRSDRLGQVDASSTRSASRSTAPFPATTTSGWSARLMSLGASEAAGRASTFELDGQRYVAAAGRAADRTTGGATTKEARLERTVPRRVAGRRRHGDERARSTRCSG